MEEMKDRILQYLQEHPKQNNTSGDILRGLEIPREEAAAFRDVLEEMKENYEIITDSDGRLRTAQQAGVFEGRLSISRSGLGYVDREDRAAVRISETDQLDAMVGDIVYVQCSPWQMYGQILAVKTRSRDSLIATYTDNGHGLRAVIDDEKIRKRPYKVMTPPDLTPVDGLKVLCDIEKYSGPMTLRVRQIIGHKDDPGVDILSILLDHDINPEFPESVIEQLKTIPSSITPADREGRKDQTGISYITIDGDDSKDFDDAVYCEKKEDGWQLFVAIADVSHYVQAGTPLDTEAAKRGTSTYVTDRVVPMLPHQLSNGICSLNPHEERLTITCEMSVMHDGTIQDYQIYPSIIRSCERMTYANANKILDGDEALKTRYSHIDEMLNQLTACADAIRHQRHLKGAIDFDTRESKIIVDENGHPTDVRPAERGHAEMVIEDCMIAANVSVANFLRWQDIPAIYRVHGEPAAKKMRSFINASEIMGHKLVTGKSGIYPNEIQRYLESVKNTAEYPVLAMMLLRCMQKAKYDAVCAGHFGLGEEEYLHFTSPIRRYPDLIVHRMLRKYSFEQNMDLTERIEDESRCAEYAELSSIRERISQDAEYACEDMKKAEYMSERLGMKAQGIITSVTSFGFYVQLDNTIEGLVRIASLDDDYYEYVSERMELVGIGSGRVYRIGLKVNVKVLAADPVSGTIEFGLYGKNGFIPAKKKTVTKAPRQKASERTRRKHGRQR